MKKVYLVINKNKNANFLAYKDIYMVFSDLDKAIEKLVELGWETGGIASAMGINTKVGMANVQMCGDVNLMIMPIEIVE